MTKQTINNIMDHASELTILQQQIRQCRLCQDYGYLAHAQPLVSGRADDRILVIGQAPGHRSITKGQPFSGPGGRILQKWLEEAGFSPGYLHEHTYLSSLTRCDPGKNARGDGDRRPSPPELALCRPYLEAELRIIQPKVVLLVGTMAIETFLVQPPQNGQKNTENSSQSPNALQSQPADSEEPKKSGTFAPGKLRLENIIGTYQEHNNLLFLPLPHPSGVSRWLNTSEHQQLLHQALSILAEWRQRYNL